MRCAAQDARWFTEGANQWFRRSSSNGELKLRHPTMASTDGMSLSPSRLARPRAALTPSQMKGASEGWSNDERVEKRSAMSANGGSAKVERETGMDRRSCDEGWSNDEHGQTAER